MTAADIPRLVRAEVERLFGGSPHVRFSSGGTDSARPGAFFDRFVDVMSAIHGTLRELTDRVGHLETRMSNLEQTLAWRGQRPSGEEPTNHDETRRPRSGGPPA